MQNFVSNENSISYPKDDVIDAIQYLVKNSDKSLQNFIYTESFANIHFFIMNGLHPFAVDIIIKETNGVSKLQTALSTRLFVKVSEDVMLARFNQFFKLLERKLKGEKVRIKEIKNLSGPSIKKRIVFGITFIGLIVSSTFIQKKRQVLKSQI